MGHVVYTKNRTEDKEVILNRIVTSEVRKTKQLRVLDEEKKSIIRNISQLNDELVEIDASITEIEIITKLRL